MADPPELSEDFLRGVLQNTIEVWVTPEVVRRVAEGRLPHTFDLTAAQVVFNVGAPVVVRLNAEVRGLMKATAARDLEAGEVVLGHDIADIESMELLPDSDPNAAHVTIIRIRDKWWVWFDRRYNAERTAQLRTRAREFLDTAASALDRGALAPFAENLWAAVELLAKAWLMYGPDEALLNAKTHRYIVGRYNLSRKDGAVDPRFASLLNELTQMRDAARYAARPLTVSPDTAREMVRTAEDMYQHVEALAPTRTPLSAITNEAGS